MTTLQVSLPPEVLREASPLADAERMSVEEFVVRAVSEKLNAFRALALLKERAPRGRHVDIDAILAKVPDVPPVPGDELE